MAGDPFRAFFDALANIPPAWIGAFGTVIAAGFATYLTIRGGIRSKAWAQVYSDKRGQIGEFVDLLDRFGYHVFIIGELRTLESASAAVQYRSLTHWARIQFPRSPQGTREAPVDMLFDSLPRDRDEVLRDSPEVRNQLAGSRMFLINLILDELMPIHLRIGILKSRLLLTARDPDAAETAHRLIAEIIGELLGDKGGIQGFDFDSFPDRWARTMSTVKLRFRQDMVKSARGLKSAVRLSPVWRLRRRVRRLLKRTVVGKT